ncbi:hypothetical protein MHTCC0001_04060 [Flavobacteriaceae bacterium MHTCC 0001]
MTKINFISECQSERSRRPSKFDFLKHFGLLRKILSFKIYFEFSSAQCDNHFLSSTKKFIVKRFCICFTMFVLLYCKQSEPLDDDKYVWHSITVTATAYNSLKSQTDATPNITAFGDTLTTKLKCIAVSRDLLKKGLKHNTPVIIEGLEGVYYVKDKMHSRWKNKIDVYMGTDVKAAKIWGRKQVCIDFGVPK